LSNPDKSAIKAISTSSDDLNHVIIDSILDIKGKNILKMDLRELEEAPADFFILCEGDSVTQVKSISENISKRIKEECGIRPNHVEGMQNSQWILVDYFGTIVHIFHPETRSFYELEDLWSDAKFEEYHTI
jgi:ribosome-associated protein